MILKKLEIEGYGPFSSLATIEIDEQVTILTGKNDVGKTSILNLIRSMCQNQRAAQTDLNLDHLGDANVSWDQYAGTKCTATFLITKSDEAYYKSDTKTLDDEVDVVFFPARQEANVVAYRREGIPLETPERWRFRFPTPFWLPLTNEIGSIISPQTTNPAEQKLLQIAFGENGIANNAALPPAMFGRVIKRASDRLNAALEQIMPSVLGMKIVVEVDSKSATDIIVGFQDEYGGDAPLAMRGAGVRKLLTLIMNLSEIESHSEHGLILYDEPENSLHADAQHVLRAMLEKLAAKENLQVIYTTHSPSMINSYHHTGLRLLKRARVNDRPHQLSNSLRLITAANFAY